MSENIQAGTVWVNTYSQLDPSVPFGGLKSSGYGKEGGLEQIADYLATKAVIMIEASVVRPVYWLTFSRSAGRPIAA